MSPVLPPGGRQPPRLARCLHELVRANADARGSAPALLGVAREPSSHGRLLRHAEAVGAALGRHGVRPGDRVAVVLPNGPELAMAFLGVACHTACAPLIPESPGAELTLALGRLRAKAVIVPAGAAEAAREAAAACGAVILDLAPEGEEAGALRLDGPAGSGAPLPPAGPDDVALLLSTSGTTSRPRLVPLRHRDLCAAARTIAESLDLTAGDRCLNVMPLFHLHALSVLLASLHAGASVACPPPFEADRFFEWLERFAPTWYSASPTLHHAILERCGEHAGLLARRRLRLIRSTSSPLAPTALEALERAFAAPVIEAYALTEAPSQVASNPLPPGRRKPGSVGRVNGPEVAILGPDGRAAPRGQTGEVALRGPHVLRAYEGDPEANARAFVGGWFLTGDQGYLDDEGYLFITGRTKELINRGGEKIAPREVEEALLAHPAVADAAAFAAPHPRLGEDVAAAVVLRPGQSASAAELRVFAAGHLAPFKVPRQVLLVESLPRGPTGKVLRVGLAERLLAGERPSPVAPRSDLERELAGLWSAVLGAGWAGGVRDDFFLAGGDSLLAASLFDSIERRFGRRLPLSILLEGATIERLAAALTSPAPAAPTSLVPLQPRGDRPPLYLVHGIGGEVLSYAALARHWPLDQPLYGLRVRYEDNALRPFDRVEATAEHYLREVRRHQPDGPYHLSGYSFGSLVALEMALQLTRQGQQVGLLALIDGDANLIGARRLPWSLRRGIGFALNLLPWLREDLVRGGGGSVSRRLRSRVKALVRRIRDQIRGGQTASEVSTHGSFDIDSLSAPLAGLLQTHLRARQQYRPGRFGGRITVFRAQVRALFGPFDHDLGWSKVSRNVRVRSIPGNHATILTAPHVERLAAALLEELRAAQQTSAR